jgi:hypothetical protein
MSVVLLVTIVPNFASAQGPDGQLDLKIDKLIDMNHKQQLPLNDMLYNHYVRPLFAHQGLAEHEHRLDDVKLEEVVYHLFTSETERHHRISISHYQRSLFNGK